MTANAEALIEKIDAVPLVEFCSCGRPRSEHTYWVDRIYDYNGYQCPGSVGGDYRYDAVITKARHGQARAEALDALLRVPQPSAASPRNEWRLDDAGALDDVVVDDVATFRLERMSDAHVWGCVYHRDGSRTTFDLFGDRLAMQFEHESPVVGSAPQPPETPRK